MSDAVVLDAGPLGLLCNPNKTGPATAIRAWVAAMRGAGRRLIVPEIADYEVRRELLRVPSHAALANLATYELQLEYLPLTTAVLRHAAMLWAQARNAGRPTAHQHALDCDVILAAQALSLGVPVVVATGNPAHLAAFVPVDDWQKIVP